jgi:hypothetical protein
VKLLVNGLLKKTTTTTGGTGAYTFEYFFTAGDVVTVFIDGHATDGVTLTRATAANMTGIDVYGDRVIVRHENATPLSGADMNTANNADTDITTLYTDGASPVVQSGKELIIWTGKTFTPAITMDIDGHLEIQSGATYNAAANPVTIAGDFINSGTWTHTAGTDLTFDASSGTQSFNPGSSAIGSDIVINNSGSEVSLLTNNLNIGTNDITIGSGGIFSLNGRNITADILSNDGFFRLQGSETVTLTTQDTNSGTWQYVGNGIGTANTYTIKDFGATDYFHLTINDTSASNSETYSLGSALKVA